jgi:pimeloyl-ACP methyl ester carboxylesterase
MDAIVFVPGSLGSQLFADTAIGPIKIWINPIALAAQGFRKLNLDDPSEAGRITVGDVVTPIYQKMLDNLSQSGANVIPFPYDWRRNVESSSSELSTLLISEAASSDSIHIITHSLGGMVVRRALQIISTNAGMPDKIGKVILIAPANQGCFAAAYGIAGTTRHIPFLEMFPNPAPAAQAVTSSFPSLYQTLPFDHTVFPSLNSK